MLPLRCALSLLLLCTLAGLGAARPTNCTKVKGQFDEAIAYFDKLNCGVTEQQCNATCEKVACYLNRYNGVCNLTYSLDDENHREGCGHSYPCIEQYEKTCPQGCVHGTCQKRQCVCEPNWAGAACTEVACSDQTCLNGGVCGDVKSCSCAGNFTGPMCQFTFPATAWDNRNNNPQNVKQAPSFTFSFASLPLEGKLTTIPWSDTYWPSMESGIAHRYYAEEPNDFNYDLHTKEELQGMSYEELQQLSPAEKYDAFVGRYDFPTVKSEWQRTHPNDASWEGLCHGWAPASFAYKSPSPVNLTNPDGIMIPFGASDVKGLLTYFVGQYQTETGVEHDDLWFLGGRCNVDIERNPARENTSACADIHPGSFHVLLANTVGKLNTGFVADIDRNYAVWNQPVFYYNTRILSISKQNRQLTVATRMNYTKELVPDFDKQNPYSQFQDYEYTLDLDDSGQIVGGSWVSWNRPDFTWMHGVGDFYGYFEQLRTVYEQATGGPTIHSLTGKPLPHRKPVSSYRNHVHMSDATGEIGVLDQRRHSRTSWTIAPASASTIVINIKMLDTERHHGLVKIYEGPTGEGALVAVVSGSSIPEPIVVSASAVYVEFVTDVIHDSTLTSSFKATYITM